MISTFARPNKAKTKASGKILVITCKIQNNNLLKNKIKQQQTCQKLNLFFSQPNMHATFQGYEETLKIMKKSKKRKNKGTL